MVLNGGFAVRTQAEDFRGFDQGSHSSKPSMSLAKCNVCSRYDRNISVVCESRCLICSRCQGNPVIKTLFVDKAAAVSGATDGSASALPASIQL